MQMDTLTAPLLRELIERIDVYEVKGTGKNRTQQLLIHYKFVGCIDIPEVPNRSNFTQETRKGVAVAYIQNNSPPKIKRARRKPCSSTVTVKSPGGWTPMG